VGHGTGGQGRAAGEREQEQESGACHEKAARRVQGRPMEERVARGVVLGQRLSRRLLPPSILAAASEATRRCRSCCCGRRPSRFRRKTCWPPSGVVSSCRPSGASRSWSEG